MRTDTSVIESAVEDGLVKPTFDLVQDFAELSIDSFLDNGIIKEIPIVKSIVGLTKSALAIREIFLAKKLLTFFKQFHNGKVNKEKIDNFLAKFRDDSSYRNSVVEQIMVLNDRFISVEKSKVLANLLQAHVNGKFEWTDFSELSECLDALHVRSFKILDDSANATRPFHFVTDQGKDGGGVLFSAGICIIHGNHYSINAHGQYLYFYGIKGDIDYVFPKHDETN